MKKLDVSLHADEPVSAGFIRIAHKLVECTVDRIKQPTRDRDEDVHVIRTAIKRLRGMLRLVRPVISETFFNREDAHLQRSARRLAFSRDMTVARKALTALFHSLSNKRQQSAVAAALTGFEKYVEFKPRVENAMNQVARDLEQTGHRIQRLRISGRGWEAIEPGLKAVYRQGRRRMNAAFANGDDQSFHKWRIRVKDLYYELQLLEPVWPKRLGKIISRLAKLQTKIGDNHDLVVLRTLIERRPDSFGGGDTVGRVKKCLARKSRRLKKASQPLGKRIFDEKPGVFVRKLSKHWNRWRKRK